VVNAAADGGWIPAWHSTVIGAAHRRRGLVCQDFSLVRQLRSPAGASLQLLAVADGHGAARYRYSDAGSRLACEQAAEAVRAALQATPLHNLKAWRRMLAEDLPQVIQSRWLAAIERNWQQRPAGEREPFCSSLYGSTLGLLLLAPGWWGCTGLGDWDLVQVSSTGSQLVSEEAPLPGAGEATASLCLPEARARWAERAQLRTIPAASAPFALLISTDGVRKSCATDADFLELCNQIMGIRDSPQLPQGLAEISAGGSGDDLSIAVGRWCPAAGECHGPRGTAAALPPIHQASRRQRMPLTSLVLMPLVLALGAAAWLARSEGWRWFSTGQTPAEPASPLPAVQREAERLCRDPGLIGGTLSQRSQQFSQLRAGAGVRQQLLANAAQDPLGALIAWSQPALVPPPVGGSAPQTMPSARPARPFPVPGSCTDLDQALAQQWHGHGPASAPLTTGHGANAKPLRPTAAPAADWPVKR
jgi:hypothetical protein